MTAASGATERAAAASCCCSWRSTSSTRDYAAALDERRFDDWPEFFLADGRYTVQARENFDRGLPLALIALESQGHDEGPRVRHHADDLPRAVLHAARGEPGAACCAQEGERIRAQANYAVFRTRPGDASEVYNVGRYIDEIVRTPDGPEASPADVRVRQRDDPQLADLSDLARLRPGRPLSGQHR